MTELLSKLQYRGVLAERCGIYNKMEIFSGDFGIEGRGFIGK